MATPPTFIQEAETAWNTSTSPKTTASFTVNANDILVAFAVNEGYDISFNPVSLSVSGGSLTWTSQQEIQIDSYTYVRIWTAVVDTGKSMTVSFTATNNNAGNWFGGNVLTFRGSDGVGASAKTNVLSGAPSLAVTTQGDNSAVVVASGDWTAQDGTSRTWRTVNGITPTSGNGLEQTYFRDAAHYVAYGAYYSDAGAAGSKTVGLSAPGSQKYSIVAVEVKGAAAAYVPYDLAHSPQHQAILAM